MLALAVMSALAAPSAFAQTVVGADDNYTIRSDTDGLGSGNVILENYNGGGTHTLFTVGDDGVSTNKNVTATGTITGGNLSTGGTLGVTGQTTTAGIGNTGLLANTGTFTQIGASTLTGVTSINTTGTAATTIGGAGGTTSINSATNNIGVNTFATTNNIGNGAATSINNIGNNYVGTTVNSYAGAGYSTLNNTNATMGTGTGGMVQTNATTATIRASSSGTLASNGSTGAMTVGAGGGYTAYATSQSTGTGSIGGVVDGKSYTNKISGNTYVDGNVYINGTLDYVSSNSANTSVVGSTAAGTGTSVLAGGTATSAGTAIVLKGATGTQTVVDANGKLTNVTGTATQSTAALTLTNGIGNTHGLVITETQASLSGGTHSSTLTMADNGGTFSDAATGAPVQVHGVNDGTSDFDAVNVRQFSSAIASITAMANIPQVDQDKTVSMGMALGSFMGKTALAAGVTYRFTKNGVLKGSVSSAMNASNSTAVGVGAAWSY